MATEDTPVVSWKLDHSAKGEFVRRGMYFALYAEVPIE
jgi:hypothetical protein